MNTIETNVVFSRTKRFCLIKYTASKQANLCQDDNVIVLLNSLTEVYCMYVIEMVNCIFK